MRHGRAHDKLCTMEDTGTISSLSANATVSCSKCGVKAHDPADVCDPVQLPEAHTFGD
ncbi:hypothetical protein KI811_01320 [Geobacter hydrogenophilus]|uniref:Uncharacterized protein n=1 Tax=Geobacter hydrogenophilus TaxID=40983 RepID=A0A9W6LEB1_9BACT|nr:hypothetical protein [Geobacter hydrogenophilus]MBT0892459.1 hypothetical protein [Geobacter hydrogenophilus]GLI39855.1 hypothetical protein GHYDROH2_33560 [Geobacter hydrogenophilus]